MSCDVVYIKCLLHFLTIIEKGTIINRDFYFVIYVKDMNFVISFYLVPPLYLLSVGHEHVCFYQTNFDLTITFVLSFQVLLLSWRKYALCWPYKSEELLMAVRSRQIFKQTGFKHILFIEIWISIKDNVFVVLQESV